MSYIRLWLKADIKDIALTQRFWTPSAGQYGCELDPAVIDLTYCNIVGIWFRGLD